MVFGRLVRVEWTKTMRMLSTYMAFAAAGALVMMVQFGLFYGREKNDAWEFFVKQGLKTSMLVNGFVTTRITMELGFALLVAPMVIQIFARQVAGEDLRGTLRLILSRPIGRVGLMNAKFLVCAVYSFMLMGFILALSYGMGVALYGPQDTITVSRARDFKDRELAKEVREKVKAEVDRREAAPGAAKVSPEEVNAIRSHISNEILLTKYGLRKERCVPRLIAIWLLSSVALLTLGSLSFLFSVVNKHPIAAMAATLGTYFLVVILQGLASQDNILPLFKEIKPYLFTTAMDFWRGGFDQVVDWDQVRHDALLLLAYSGFFYGLAQYLFWRKDITS